MDREATGRASASWRAASGRASRSSSIFRSPRFTSRRCRILSSPERPAPGTSATRWRKWIATSAWCWTRSRGSASSSNTIVIWAQRRRRGGPPAVARDVGSVARLLQHGDGRRHPHAVHDSLAGPHSRRAGLQRDRARHRCVHDARARGRRRACRRTAPSTAWISCRSSRASRRSRTVTASSIFAPDGQVRAVKWGDWKLHYVWQDEPGQPVERIDEAVQPALGSEGGDGHQGRQPLGAESRSAGSSAISGRPSRSTR